VGGGGGGAPPAAAAGSGRAPPPPAPPADVAALAEALRRAGFPTVDTHMPVLGGILTADPYL
jgi:hypothetical protein